MVVVGQCSLTFFLIMETLNQSLQMGMFNFGEVGDVAYSLNIDTLHRAIDEELDVMMQYGDEEVGTIIQYDYQKFEVPFMFR